MPQLPNLQKIIMAKRFRDTDIWDKDWFMNLSTKHKCLISFLYDKCDVAGIWNPNWVLASTYIGEKVSKNDLIILGDLVEELPDGKIWVTGFVAFQYGELSEKCAPHKKIFAQLKKYGLLERVLKGYCKGTDTLKDMDRKKNKKKDKEEEEEKEEEKPPENFLIIPFDTVQFRELWDGWKKYKKEQHHFQYISPHTEQAAMKELAELSNYNEQLALKIIEQSIAKGWKGFFKLKTDEQSGTTKNGQQQPGAGRNADYKRELAERMAAGSGNGHNNTNSSP